MSQEIVEITYLKVYTIGYMYLLFVEFEWYLIRNIYYKITILVTFIGRDHSRVHTHRLFLSM